MRIMFLNSQKKASVAGIIVHAVLHNFMTSVDHWAIIEG